MDQTLNFKMYDGVKNAFLLPLGLVSGDMYTYHMCKLVIGHYKCETS